MEEYNLNSFQGFGLFLPISKDIHRKNISEGPIDRCNSIGSVLTWCDGAQSLAIQKPRHGDMLTCQHTWVEAGGSEI